MTGTYCGNCGAQRAPGANFCPACGAPLPAPPVEQAPQPGAGPWAAPQQPGLEYTAAPPPYVTSPVPQPSTWPQQPEAGPPYATPPAYTPSTAPQPAAAWGTPQQPAAWAAAQPAAPWGGPVPGAPHPGAPRRSYVDALLTGDWGGAARAAGLAVGAMLALSLVGALLITEGGIGFRETLALVLGGASLAVGGNAYLEAGAGSFGTSGSLGVLPLTVTLVGLALLGRSYGSSLRSRPPASAVDGLLQGVRTALVFTACFLPLSLLTRYEAEPADALGVDGRVGVGVVSTVVGALLFAVATLGLTWLLSSSTELPGRVGAVRHRVRAPLAGALAVFATGLLAVLVALLHLLVEEGDRLVSLGVTLIGGANGALAGVLWSAGVPLDAEGSATSGVLGELTPSGSQSVDLITFTDASAWFWLAPVVLLAAMVVVAAALAVRHDTVEGARREGARFAAALAAVAFVAALLLRISVEGEGGVEEFGDLQATADASVLFNPFLAAVVLGVWGVVIGLLAPVVAARVPSGFVAGVRRRFGVAPGRPTPPVG
ncbi:zinc-ribbon domain-containing protein [Geodermatophilus sp. SYSU D00758]